MRRVSIHVSLRSVREHHTDVLVAQSNIIEERSSARGVQSTLFEDERGLRAGTSRPAVPSPRSARPKSRVDPPRANTGEWSAELRRARDHTHPCVVLARAGHRPFVRFSDFMARGIAAFDGSASGSSERPVAGPSGTHGASARTGPQPAWTPIIVGEREGRTTDVSRSRVLTQNTCTFQASRDT